MHTHMVGSMPFIFSQPQALLWPSPSCSWNSGNEPMDWRSVCIYLSLCLSTLQMNTFFKDFPLGLNISQATAQSVGWVPTAEVPFLVWWTGLRGRNFFPGVKMCWGTVFPAGNMGVEFFPGRNLGVWQASFSRIAVATAWGGTCLAFNIFAKFWFSLLCQHLFPSYHNFPN